jgi:hypothetical protein
VCVYRFLFSSYKRDYAIRDSVGPDADESNWYQERWGVKFQLRAIRTKGPSSIRTRPATAKSPRWRLHRRPRPDGHLRRSHRRGPGW